MMAAGRVGGTVWATASVARVTSIEVTAVIANGNLGTIPPLWAKMVTNIPDTVYVCKGRPSLIWVNRPIEMLARGTRFIAFRRAPNAEFATRRGGFGLNQFVERQNIAHYLEQLKTEIDPGRGKVKQAGPSRGIMSRGFVGRLF
jgi:hypothetical protein